MSSRTLDLIPPEWTWALGDVTTQGSKKYAARNWEQGMDWSKVVACMKRHIEKFLAGERYDHGETGCHHLAMVAWNALALMTYDIRGIGKMDLPKLDYQWLQCVNEETSPLPVYLSEDDWENEDEPTSEG